MIGKLQKITANPFDKMDQVQFRIGKEDVDSEILEIRKNQECKVKLTGLQSQMLNSETGEITVGNEWIEFTADNISISLTILEEGIIATITVCTHDKDVVRGILEKDLRGRGVELDFVETIN